MAALAAAAAILLLAHPAGAVLDNGDGGPTLRAGGFAMRVTNAGILGNAFFDNGLSNDPSFEFPIHSGTELMHHAELWVGARDAFGDGRVSGGPALEWRPSTDANDRVREAWRGQLGSRQRVDDDGDGGVDEEALNGQDDDGDGDVDEDLGFDGQQVLAAEYRDDRPEAVYYAYPGGEPHRPLGLTVRQQAFCWSTPGYDGFAALEFTITNHGDHPLEDVYIGLYADLDVRQRNLRTGHLDDIGGTIAFSRSVYEGTISITQGGVAFFSDQSNPQGLVPCNTELGGSFPVVRDSRAGGPLAAVLALDHTTDPVARVAPELARAPATASFHSTVFSRREPPQIGGFPVLDADRYAALAGRIPSASTGEPDDYAALVSCGPFARLDPGRSLRFVAAIVAAASPDSLESAMARVAGLHHGDAVNLLPDTLRSPSTEWNVGETGLNAHEVCLEAPAGTVLVVDPHCGRKFVDLNHPDGVYSPPEVYRPGACRWTDADCDVCTGILGRETRLNWTDPGSLPPAPRYEVTAFDREVRIAWNNYPEIAVSSGLLGFGAGAVRGYRVYKLADWRARQSLLPPRENWELLAAFGPDSANGQRPLATATDSTIDYERILFEQKLYPPGRYAVTDRRVLDGFDYVYAVTTVTEALETVGGGTVLRQRESPLVASFAQKVTPHATATPAAGGVWVVPNPYRARAPWERPPVIGDDLTQHVDFFGLPRARATIKVWTVAGDLVAQIEHDGSAGDGQAPWNLVSRNGQDVESGIYLFTVDSPLGRQTGRFVIVR